MGIGRRARAWHGHEGDFGMHVGVHGMERGWTGLWGGDGCDVGMDRCMGMVRTWIKWGHENEKVIGQERMYLGMIGMGWSWPWTKHGDGSEWHWL